jgi:hypothetical protein
MPLETKTKIKKVITLLESYLDLINTEVPRQWQRFQEYFEVWADLIREN